MTPATLNPKPAHRLVRVGGDDTYRRAVAAGSYSVYQGNLSGKFDNVRLYWEDQFTRRILLKPICGLLERRRKPLRVLDLGCGSGQGYEILLRLERDTLNLTARHDWILKEGDIDYTGVDLCEAMVAQGRHNYGDNAQVRFGQQDLNEGLGRHAREAPFDLYFSSYGSLSHLTREPLVNLLAEAVRHGHSGSLVVLDLVGRYSIEWPQYWSTGTEEEKYRDYSMNYLHLGDPEAMAKAEHFPLRFWSGEEIPELLSEAEARAGRRLRAVEVADRSLLIGRHVDTRHFNPKLHPWRGVVNSLLEDDRRTDLKALLVPENAIPAGGPVTAFLREFIRCWNFLIEFTRRQTEKPQTLADIEDWSSLPAPLQFALMSVDRVIGNVGWMHFGDPRANIIEKQLAYLLRGLERRMQQGLGAGHGLVVVAEIG